MHRRLTRLLLFSGGLDSFVGWRLLDHPPVLYGRLDHRYQGAELRTVYYLQARAATLGLPAMEVHLTEQLRLAETEAFDAHVPFRNLLLANLGALRAQTVYLGALAGETSRDKTGRFERDTTRLLRYVEPHLGARLVLPFRHLTKTELVALYLRRFPGEREQRLFLGTRSCYAMAERDADVVGCGRCMACFRRWVAITLNGLSEQYEADPADYPVPPPRQMFRSLWYADWREWTAIARSNLDAHRALHAAGVR